MSYSDTGNKYGTESFGALKKVMLHRPEMSIGLITEENREFFLFDSVPDTDRYLEEHSRYEELLRMFGIEVHLLKDHVSKNKDLLYRLPNLAYLCDTAVISSHGSIISKMSTRGRCHEEIVVGEALADLGIPKLYEPPEGEAFEACLLLSRSTLFVADTERHSRRSIESFIEYILGYFSEVIYAFVPQERRFMHADMFLGRITENLLIYYPAAFIKTFRITKEARTEIDLKDFMKKRDIDMIAVSDEEQKKWGCSFVPIKPGTIINYDISLKQKTVNTLERYGVKFVHFHPDALLAGGGSLRCLTMRIYRE